MVSIEARKEAAREIARIVPLAMRTIAAQLRRGEHQIDPPHFRLLGMLAHCPCNMGELAEKHAVSPATISNSITILEERGWVKRIRSPHDRRVVMVELTSEGSDVLVEVHSDAEEHLAALLAVLSEEEHNALLAGLAALRKAFSEIPSDCMGKQNYP